MTPPRRFKTTDELTPAEHAERQKAARQGMPAPKFETAEYAEARDELLERKGFDTDDDEPDPDSPETHAARRYGDAA